MNKVSLLSLFFCCLLVAPSFQYGILIVEEIWSTEHYPNVQIEEMIVQESDIFIDFIEDLSGSGVTVEDVIFSDGSITIPGNFFTHGGVEFLSALHANGGIFADAGLNSGDFSFIIEDNTGDVYVKTDVRAQGGVSVSDQFTMDGRTGDTIIKGVTRPNGGIFVNEDIATFTIDGEVFTQGNIHVTNDVYFGAVSSTSTRTITRFPTAKSYGGNTILQGQDASVRGGDLILEPGSGATTVGDIYLGSQRNSDLFFGRSALSSYENGGSLRITGQASTGGDGGDLFLNGGKSDVFGFGGDIHLVPGLSALDGTPGKLIVGSPVGPQIAHDLIMGRPPLASGNGGITTYQGQTTTDGLGGSIYLRAGDVVSGTGNPGDLILTAGLDAANEQTIVFGKATATRLNLRRVETVDAGSATILTGQNTTNGIGGDLRIRAGTSGTGTAGGSLYLVPGSSVTGNTGNIVLGVATDALDILRPSITSGTAGLTTISGQDALEGVGGDLFLVGADGLSQGGDVVIEGGFGTSAGGTVSITSGSGTVAGEIIMRAGHAFNRNGGEIVITATNAPVTLSTQSVATNTGRIIAGPAAARFYIDEVPVVLEDSLLVVRAGQDVVTIAPNPAGIVLWNGVAVLKETQTLVAELQTAQIPDATQLIAAVNNLSIDLNNVIRTVDQCGHGMVTSVTQPGNVVSTCPAP